MTPRVLSQLDLAIGTKIRERRVLLSMTQTDLGKRMGITFQQIQKYERGFNSLNISRLLDVAKALDVSLDYFLGDMQGKAKRPEPSANQLVLRREHLEMIKKFSKLPVEVRGSVLRHLNVLAKTTQEKVQTKKK